MADNIVRLKVDSTEYDSKIKRAAAGIQHMADACHRAGGVLNVLEKENKEYIQGLGHMETVSRSARGRLAELTSAFTDIKSVYHNLTAEEKASPFGRELAKQLDIMKGRIGDTRLELASINKELGGSKFGQLGGIIDNIGQRFGVTGNLTEMLTSKTALLTGAIGALSAAVVKGGEAWLQYNEQMARQDEITTVTTGLKGADADRMTDQAKALAQTYGTDFREVINAANTLMTQFGKTGDESMKLLRDGMRGMIHGDGPKLLSMIQQFAPSFQSAGVSASQLVAVIQNSEGGIFTDQNMQSIVMGIKNIRLMTNATAEALAKVGIDGRQMTKEMNDGSLTVFEALKKVAGALSKVDGNSQAAGEVMQTVFGRQGMMAGTNLGKAIAELNTNLETTKTQTGEVGKSFDDLYEANVKLNKAIRDAFQYDGWDQMANGIKGKLITALADVVSALADVRDVAKDTYKWFDYTLGVGNWIEAGSKVADQMAQNMSAAYKVARMLYGFLDKKAAERAAADAANKALEDVGNAGVLPQGAYPKAAEDNRKKEIQDLDTLKRKLKELEEQRRDAVKAGDQVKVSDLTNQVNQVKTNIGYLDPNFGKNKISTKTPQGKAGDIVSKAEAEYAATLDKIAVRREAGLDTALQSKQKEVAATEKLYDAYTTAYNTYADPTYKDMASFTASMLGALAGKVNEAKDAQDAEKQAAQQLAEAEKKKAREMEQQKLMGNFSESGISAGISYLKGKKAEAVIGSAEYKNFDTQLTDATTMGTLTGVMDKYNITPDQINVDAAGIWQKIINGNDIANADWQGVADAINEKLSEMGIEPIKLDVQTGGLKNVAKDVDVLTTTTKNAGSAMNTLGGALASLEDPSAKVAGIIMQAIGNVALSFSQAMLTPKDPWSWIAFAVAGTATMISTIAAIHSATGYAEGGVIPGNSFSGDNQLARVNAGELILSKSAQANLANQLENPATPGGGSDRTPYLRGQDIFLGLNNYLRSSGRGQLVTSRG